MSTVPRSLVRGQDPDADAEEHQARTASEAVLGCSAAAWAGALESQDTELLLKIFWGDMEAYLSMRTMGTNRPPKAFCGRGQKPRFVKETLTARQNDEGSATTVRQVRLGKLARRVEEVVRKLHHRDVLAPIAKHTWEVWDKCCIDGKSLLPFLCTWDGRDIPSMPCLSSLGQEIRWILQHEQACVREGRKDAWARKFAEDYASKRQMCFSYQG